MSNSFHNHHHKDCSTNLQLNHREFNNKDHMNKPSLLMNTYGWLNNKNLKVSKELCNLLRVLPETKCSHKVSQLHKKRKIFNTLNCNQRT